MADKITKEVQFEDLFRIRVDSPNVVLDIAEEFSSVAMTVEDTMRLSTLLVKAAKAADAAKVDELVEAQKEATRLQKSRLLG